MPEGPALQRQPSGTRNEREAIHILTIVTAAQKKGASKNPVAAQVAADSDVDVDEEDIDFVKEHHKRIGFLQAIDSTSTDRYSHHHYQPSVCWRASISDIST